MLPRIVFAIVSSIVTVILAAIAISLPEGRLMQATALAALVTGMIAMLVIFLSAAEVLSHLFSGRESAASAGAETSERRPPTSPTRGRRAA